jgi:hypothetical protein
LTLRGTQPSCSTGNDPALRETVFGMGRGLLNFHVVEDAEVIRIFNIAWIG